MERVELKIELMRRIILVGSFILYSGLIVYLSFQPGGETVDTSMKFTRFILGLFIGDDVSYESMVDWHMRFRLLAHPVIFCLFSILAMRVVSECFRNRWICVVIAGGVGIILAILTECLKRNIPGRHFDLRETWLNVAGVVIGLLLYTLISKVYYSLMVK